MQKQLVIVAVFALCASQARAEEKAEASTAQLEQGYAAKAEELRSAVARKLLQQAVRDTLFANTSALVRYQAEVAHRKIEPFSDGIVLSDISSTPPSLKKDPNDLYQRFHSEVKLQFYCVKPSGERAHDRPIEITIPVAARPFGEWIFPNTETVLTLLGDHFDQGAAAVRKLEKQVAALRASNEEAARELAADKARARSRKARQKAEQERYDASLSPWMKRELERMRKQPPVKP